MENPEQISRLFEKYMRGTATPGEQEILSELVAQYTNEELADLLEPLAAASEGGPAASRSARPFLAENWEPIIQAILQYQYPAQSRPAAVPMGSGRVHRLFSGVSPRRWAAAAVIFISLAAGTWLWLRRPANPASPVIAVSNLAGDIAAGGDKATLTLADGSTIALDSAHNGQLATQQGSQILKKNGQLVYNPESRNEGVPAYNTLRTPRGGTYRLSLPDGTKVWLNAASSISYPVVFTGKERVVEMTGEAYFEVAPHVQMPFKVKVNEANSIAVLGTQFNVKAYTEDDLISTTLLEGAVRVGSNGKKITLEPGQQAQASVTQLSVKTLGKTGISAAIAWKEGRFNFQDANLQEIMRQLSRWYNIEVVYEKGVPEQEFIGEIERSLPLSEVLKGLKMSGVHFRLENGKRLIVSP